MTATDSTAMPAAWYPCPVDATRLRWWDGDSWTEHTADPSDVAVVEESHRPVEQPQQSRAEYRQHWLVPSQTKPTTTLWVWLLCAVPIVQVAVFVVLVDIDPSLALSVSFGLATLGYLAVALRDAAVLAERDHRTIGWGWGLLPPGYFILRIVRLGRPSVAPFAAWFVAQLAALAVATMFSMPLYAQMNTVAHYDGEPAAGASAEPLTIDDRAALLTPTGMSAKILADLRAEGSEVNAVTCPTSAPPADADHVTCRVEMEYAAADVDVQVTDNYPNVAFVVLRFHYDE